MDRARMISMALLSLHLLTVLSAAMVVAQMSPCVMQTSPPLAKHTFHLQPLTSRAECALPVLCTQTTA
jgi:hypothetical protein